MDGCSHLVITPVQVWRDQKPAAPDLESIGVLCEHLLSGVTNIPSVTGLNGQQLECKDKKKKKIRSLQFEY